MGLRIRAWRRKLVLKRQRWQRRLKVCLCQSLLGSARVLSLRRTTTQRWTPRCLRELPATSSSPPRLFPPGMTKGKVSPEHGSDQVVIFITIYPDIPTCFLYIGIYQYISKVLHQSITFQFIVFFV